ncbi:unnamed protein product [Rhodiola kirilowii]
MESDWARIHSTELVSKLHGQRQHSIEVQIRTSDVEKRGERCCRRSAWLVQTIEFHVVIRRFYAASVSQGALLGKSPKMTPPPPDQKDGLHFFCGLYPDALGIHSVSLRPPKPEHSSGFLMIPSKYPLLEMSDLNCNLDREQATNDFQVILLESEQDLDEKMREALHRYIDERGINESLFPFLQAWLYVKDHRKAIRWFKSIGSFIKEHKQNEAW